MFFFRQCLLFTVSLIAICSGEDYYELLGVAKSANNREIRKAFKKLAVKLHPDKNKDDPSAQTKFIQLTSAYETLKDGELRKKYDLYGEEDIKENRKQNYHSWSYYHDNFGIYDDDPEIITFDRADFEQNVVNSNSLWFINFYSPMCSHCHNLAPTWRKLARALEGVLRFGAVNCEEDRNLCQGENIHSYPSLVLYPHREKYNGVRSADIMERHVINMLPVEIFPFSFGVWRAHLKRELFSDKPWVLFLCYDEEECADESVQMKIASILDAVIYVGVVDCRKDMKLCTSVGGDTNVVFWENAGSRSKETFHQIVYTDFKDLARKILSFLPEATALDSKQFEEMRDQLYLDSAYSWLVCFYMGSASDEDMELKKLRGLLNSKIRIGKVHCGHEVSLCQKMHINRYPVFAIFKRGGNYEFYHGRETAHDIANFVEESRLALNIGVLNPETFQELVMDNKDSASLPWIVEFYAPWCPPCMRLLPKFRKASREFISIIKFATIDCTVHGNLCQQHNIRSYPMIILYNASSPHHFYGGHTTEDLLDFIDSFLRPTVKRLTEKNFYETVAVKSPEEIWMIDFFAPWCGPCQQLSPHWMKLGKTVSHLSKVHVGEVNCLTEHNLCEDQGVNSYPTIRLYPIGWKGLSSFAIYSGYRRDVGSLRRWLYNFVPNNVVEITTNDFENKIFNSKDTWLIDFYAPWCGHCAAFLPELQEVSLKLEGKVRTGKVNCDAHRELCKKANIRAYPTVILYQPRSPSSYYGEEIDSQSSSFIMLYVEQLLKKNERNNFIEDNGLLEPDENFIKENDHLQNNEHLMKENSHLQNDENFIKENGHLQHDEF